MKVWNRSRQCYIEEKGCQQELLNFLYTTKIGRFLLWAVAKRRWFSCLMGYLKKTKGSARKVPEFVKAHAIDLSECEKQVYDSFNDFFIRKRGYYTDTLDKELMAIADARLSIYTIESHTKLKIKGSIYTIEDLLNHQEEAKRYEGGTCLVYRLALEDYHRYVYLDDGKILNHYFVKGVLHTVRSISEHYNVFVTNAREVMALQTKHFGCVTQIEVGAMTVGKIVNEKYTGSFKKLEEKGHFEYGGSTIIQLFEPGKVVIEKDILEKSSQLIEVKVRIGEGIGYAQEIKDLF